MKLYYSKGACSLAVRILIHELGISCEYEAVNLKTKQTETGADFLTINPKGSVPTLMLDNNTILTENAVIQQYLADTHKANQLLPPMGNFSRYRVIEWLNFVSTDLHKGCGPLFNTEVPEEVKDSVFRKLLRRKLQFVNRHLEQNKYLAGDVFTLPDMYLFVLLRWAPHLGVPLTDYAHLVRYFAEIKARASVVKALAEEGLQA